MIKPKAVSNCWVNKLIYTQEEFYDQTKGCVEQLSE